ncbi:hypothetical protein [Kribbella jiaozuonensis]|uniref:Uncharacterized protein n=1 Tax=Kribbella jiaozuonensis TaxID=2575441 RepID=A0A4U3LEY5_9ACTN|nr:hypothetical protein [Kribbella jiaozuonensis]TKK73439.1 hypothetical protein FDA38_39715 [Kribbella jiaozuonensis]
MTTPPQGPWGPGQPGGQPGGQHGGQDGQGGQHGGQSPQQGNQQPPHGGQQPQQQAGWGQQPPPPQGGGWGQRPPQQGQPPHQGYPPQGQPPHGQPQQGGWGPQPGQGGQQGQPPQGWGQQPQQGGQGSQQGQPAQGWGQPPQGGPYQQQSWGQRPGQQQGGWQQQEQSPWQPGGPGGSGGRDKGPFGISKDKLPFVIGGGVVGIIVIALLVFLGIHQFGGDDTPESNPTATEQPTGGQSKGGENGELGNATGQAKNATEKLQGNGFGCSDLFNTAQGAHRGCFKYEDRSQAEALFQFKSDGTIIAIQFQSVNEDNNNNAAVVFDQVLQAVGNDTFGGDQVKKVQDAVKQGQKSEKIDSSWGEFELRNDGDTYELSGAKSGEESLDIPDKTFETTKPQMLAALKAKAYVCTSSCTKEIGKYGQQRVYFYASDGEGIKDIQVSASGDASDVKKALPTALNDAFGVLKGGDLGALKSYIQAHSDGKSYASYVAGWRVEIRGNSSDSYSSQQVEITYESFYV